MRRKGRGLSRLVALISTVALVLGSVQPAFPATPSADAEARMAEKAALVQAKRDRVVTQAEREAAAAIVKKQIEEVARATDATPSEVLKLSNIPGPGGEPDYFGMTPNWAYTPEIRKFVDGLPGLGAENANNLGQYLAVAYPDTVTYPGADYYEIELREYDEQLHSDLPTTRLRGYVQVNKGTDGSGRNTIEPDPIHYLGPTIFATKDRPVRVKFTNKLPIDEGGDLFIPVDTTYMGAGYGPLGMMEGDPMYTENRASVHLHGGKTVWISDGTPHQWITPAGENTPYPEGVSVEHVPDMPDPGDGSMTFFYSNQQSARMLWYHDHAYGITRLNVYAGMASGYFLTDDTEQKLIDDGLLPVEQIPLIVQDKTFVDAETITTSDPTWNWGITPGTAHTGDLWFPHVYMPAQNPALADGVNPMGRWHYAPWFFPPPPAERITHPPVPNTTYYDPINAPWEYELKPGTEDVSSGMEAFNDTPLVNGTAYPVLEVDPKAYRFRILNAASDRFFNLQLYVADPSVITCDGRRDTEVKMVDAKLTAGWPADWPVDGREGGVPDPATAGPEWIQVATESGFLPQPAVFPNQPITWVADPTLFNVGNVDKHAMLLAPAERSDVVLDFSKYAGKTLILYNDAPSAFPAGDPRYDYYTGAPDMTDTGGTAGTQAGFGPNTRTVMQIKVAPRAAAPAFDLAALQEAFVSTDTKEGVFESSQNKIIIPDSRYDTTYNDTFPADQYVRIFQMGDDGFHTFTNLDGAEQTFPLEAKAIQDEQGETFDSYGRMQGNIGLELPTGIAGLPNFILYGFMDVPTEVLSAVQPDMVPLTPVMGDGTQIWKITHNGVDTHPMHFHLYDVQLINRVGWDGFLRFPDDNELGWKDTVRVNPLEDTIVALRPVAPKAPFNVPDSVRPLDPTMELGSMMGLSQIDPATGQKYDTPLVNKMYNFHWEYVWHCHILSHEEMDMMRPQEIAVDSILASAPVLAAGTAPPGVSRLEWVDATPGEAAETWGDLSNEIGFKVERASVDASGAAGPYSQIATALANQTVFDDPDIAVGDTWSYRVTAYNEAGDSASNEATVGPIVDDTAPVTTSNLDGEWHKGPFSVELEATDVLSGVSATYYKLDGGPTQTYSGPFDLVSEGTHSVEFWSEDALSLVESAQTGTVKIDSTPPVTTDDHEGSYTGSALITLTPTDLLSGPASTRWSLDGGPLKTGTVVNTPTQGPHTLEYRSTDVAGNVEATRTANFAVLPPNATYVQLEGPDRIATALDISRTLFPLNSVDTVVIASSASWPDALVGTSLAGAHRSPILLTGPGALHADLPAEIARLGASKAVILGGTGALGAGVEASLKSKLGAGNVTRIGGTTRYDTARLVAMETERILGCNYDGTAFVTTGRDFPDALGAGPLASAKGWPIYLVPATGLDARTASAMAHIGVSKALILGGTDAVAASVGADIVSDVGATVTRLSGPTRYETAVAVAKYGVMHADLGWNRVALATGQDFPDGLSAGAGQGFTGSVLLLTPSANLHAAPAAALKSNKDDIAELRFIGGSRAVTPLVRSRTAALLN